MKESNKYEKGLVTVAIPAFKKKYLAEAISSVLSQTYNKLELIIVNDHSPEDLDCIVRSFKDKRIRYYKNAINLGRKSIVYNWNTCLSHAQGEFFVLLCDDDIMDKEFIMTLMSLEKKHPLFNVFKSRTVLYDETSSRKIGETKPWPEKEEFPEFLANTLKGMRHHTISEFMYRTAFINSKGGYVVFPAGYYSDIASVLYFSEDKGIISSEKCLLTFRKSAMNISSRDDYSFEKSKAAIQYYSWLKDRYDTSHFNTMLDHQLDFDLYEYYQHANFIDSIKIIFSTPSSVWNTKKKLLYIFTKLSTKKKR